MFVKDVSPTPLTTAGRNDTNAAGCQISCLGMSEITADSRTNRRQDRAEADSGSSGGQKQMSMGTRTDGFGVRGEMNR